MGLNQFGIRTRITVGLAAILLLAVLSAADSLKSQAQDLVQVVATFKLA